jgi:threonine synthase
LAAVSESALDSNLLVVCVITGHGLKDPETAERLTPPPTVIPPNPDAITAAAR